MADNQVGSLHLQVTAATGSYEESLRRTKQAHDQLTAAIEQGSARSSRSYSRAQQETEKASGQTAQAFTNLAQQAQDAAVQIQAGTSWATVIAQQLPQAAGALTTFGGALGAAGAIAGSFIGIGAVVATSIYNIANASKETPDLLKGMADNFDHAADLADKYAQALGRATSAQREWMREVARTQAEGVEKDLRNTFDALASAAEDVFRERAERAAPAIQPVPQLVPPPSIDLGGGAARGGLDIPVIPTPLGGLVGNRQAIVAAETSRIQGNLLASIMAEVERAEEDSPDKIMNLLREAGVLSTPGGVELAEKLASQARTLMIAKATARGDVATLNALRDSGQEGVAAAETARRPLERAVSALSGDNLDVEPLNLRPLELSVDELGNISAKIGDEGGRFDNAVQGLFDVIGSLGSVEEAFSSIRFDTAELNVGAFGSVGDELAAGSAQIEQGASALGASIGLVGEVGDRLGSISIDPSRLDASALSEIGTTLGIHGEEISAAATDVEAKLGALSSIGQSVPPIAVDPSRLGVFSLAETSAALDAGGEDLASSAEKLSTVFFDLSMVGERFGAIDISPDVDTSEIDAITAELNTEGDLLSGAIEDFRTVLGELAKLGGDAGNINFTAPAVDMSAIRDFRIRLQEEAQTQRDALSQETFTSGTEYRGGALQLTMDPKRLNRALYGEEGADALEDRLKREQQEREAAANKAKREADARREKIKAVEAEIEASRRLSVEYAKSIEAGDAMKRQVEAEQKVRQAGLDVHTREGQALLARIKLQQQYNSAIESSMAAQRIQQDIDDTSRLVAANDESASAYARVAREIEILKAVRALGTDATEAEKQAVAGLTKTLLDQHAALKQTTALREARQEREVLIGQGRLTPATAADIGRPAKPAVVKRQTAEEIEKALNIPNVGQSAAEQATEYTDAWKNAVEDLQGFVTDAFEDLFTGQLNSAEDFAKQLQSIVARGAANMLSGVIFGGGQGLFGAAGDGQQAAANANTPPWSLGSMFGAPAPVGNYSQMTLEEARMRMARPTTQNQFGPAGGWRWPTMTPQMQQRMLGLGGMGLATVGGMMGGQVGQLNAPGLMSTVGTGMMMGQGLGIGALGGGGSLLWGSLVGRAAGGGLLGGGLGALGGAGIGFATGGPIGALAGGLLGGFGGFLGGGGREARNNAAFSFDLRSGRSRQDNSPGPEDPNRQAALRLAASLEATTVSIRGLGLGLRGGTIGSSVSRTRTAEEAALEITNQLRRSITGATGATRTALRGSRAATPEELLADLQFGREFEQLVSNAGDFRKEINALNQQFDSVAGKAKALGLSEQRLAAARQRAIDEYIQEQESAYLDLVGIGGSFGAQIRSLAKEFERGAEMAREFGFNEEDLRRARQRAAQDLTRQAEEQARAANDNLRGFIDSLTEPLEAALGPQGISRGIFSPQAQANQALDQFRETMDAARRDDVQAIQNLPQMAQNAVEAARAFGASGPEFQRIFQEVQHGLQDVLTAQEDRRAQVFADLPEIVTRTAGEQIDTLREEFARTREELEQLRRDIRLLAA